MCGQYFPDATDEMTIWCEFPTWEERLELGHKRVEPANELRYSICGLGGVGIHEA